MKKLRFGFFCSAIFILIGFPFAAGSQAGAPQGAAAPAGPGFSVKHYDLTAEITPTAKSLSATALVTLQVDSKELRTVRLFLHNDFAVRRVTEGGRPLRFERPTDSKDQPMYSPSASPLDIDLGRGIAAPATVRVEIAYDGPIRDVVNGVNMISENLVEIGGYCAWFPMEKENGDFTYSLSLTLPAGSICVTDGKQVEEKTRGGKAVRVFRRDRTGFDIPVIAGPRLKILERGEAGVTARAVYQDMADGAAAASLDGAVRCAAGLVRILGEPPSASEVTVVYSPRSGWGYSRSPLIVVPESILIERLASEAGRRENFHGLAHETAHFWWNLSPTTTSDDWINESLSEYFALRAVEDAFGGAAAAEYWRDALWAIQGLPGDKAILTVLRNDPAAYQLFYQKGSILFRMVESTLGKGELDRILRKIYQEHKGRPDLTTGVFRALFDGETGSRFRGFFDRYLLKGGLPSLRLEWRAEGRSAAGRIGADDAALAGFPLTLSIRGERPSDRETRTLRLAEGANPWRFDLPFEPRRISIGPDACLLISEPDGVYSGRLTSLVHGPGMDFNPDTIPAANIEKAEAVLSEWKPLADGSPVFEFETGWLMFLKKDAPGATEAFSAVLAEREELPNKTFYVANAYRNTGLCYDLLRERESAVRFYRDGIAAAESLGLEKMRQAFLFQNYLRVPYPEGKSLHIAARAGNLNQVIALAGADPGPAVNAKDDFLGLPPILWAVQSAVRSQVVEWLVEHGAEVNVRDGSGQNLLGIVKAKGESELAKYLIAHGAKE